jgi:4a-hydroxytetrahydrobiopterin dehydratase
MKQTNTGWIESDNALVRQFVFPTYLAGVGFATRIAEESELIQHHPQITISHKSVAVLITSFEEGMVVTDKDRVLAGRINKIFEDTTHEKGNLKMPKR